MFFAGFDMSPNTAQAIKDGYQNLVIDQQPYLQGYLPILNICLTKKFGFSGLDINTAGAFVDRQERRRRRTAGGARKSGERPGRRTGASEPAPRSADSAGGRHGGA